MSERIELRKTKQTPGSGATTEPLTSFYVVEARPAWEGVLARAFADTLTQDFELLVGWKGSQPKNTVVRPGPLSPSADKWLAGWAPDPPRLLPRKLLVGYGSAKREILVIPRVHARLAWVVLALAFLTALARLLTAGWALEKSATVVAVLIFGSVGIVAWIVAKVRVVVGWFTRVDRPLLGVFPPLIPIAAALGAAFVLAVLAITARGFIVSNGTKADIQPELGVEIDPGHWIFALAKPETKEPRKFILVPAKVSAMDPLWARALVLVWAPPRYNVECQPIPFADDETRVAKGATGLTLQDGQLRVLRKEDCVAESVSATVYGAPGPSAVKELNLASHTEQPWPTTAPTASGSFSFDSPSDPRPIWVRSMNSEKQGIQWIAARSNRIGPIQVPWRPDTTTFESSDELPDGPATGSLLPIRCGESPTVVRLRLDTDLLAEMDLDVSPSRHVMRWKRGAVRGPFAIIVCGEGDDLSLDFDDAQEPTGLEMAIPSTLGVRSVHVRVHGEEIGTAICPTSGPSRLAMMRKAKDCTRDGHKGSVAIWQVNGGRHSWNSPWFCLPENARATAVREEGSAFSGLAARVNGAWQAKRMCGRVCCMHGQNIVDEAQCLGGCGAPTDHPVAGCETAFRCEGYQSR